MQISTELILSAFDWEKVKERNIDWNDFYDVAYEAELFAQEEIEKKDWEVLLKKSVKYIMQLADWYEISIEVRKKYGN